jgi:predicted aldo/keto reductase-like oxidoreductase
MNKNSRRNFIKSITALAGIPLISVSSRTPKIFNLDPQPIKRQLGKTGITLPVLSMGVMNSNNPNLVKEAWKSGIRHFDTAWVYQNGNNEKMVGQALKELKIDRKEVIIATKVLLRDRMEHTASGKDAREMILKRFNESLSRLQMDYADILYIHDVPSLDIINDPYVMDTLSELKQQKKIRFCGFSTHSYWPELLKDAADKKFYDVILLSLNISLHGDPATINAMKKASEAGIGLIAMKTQCQQDWYKQQLPSEEQKFYEGKIMHTALLKWVLRHEYIATAIPGFTTFQQLEEDLAAMTNLDYTDEEHKFLTDKNVKMAFNRICTHCGTCTESCPRNADIPSLMRSHMYAGSYGNSLMASQTLNGIAPDRGLDICRDCGHCIAKCTREVPVSARISELKEIYA